MVDRRAISTAKAAALLRGVSEWFAKAVWATNSRQPSNVPSRFQTMSVWIINGSIPYSFDFVSYPGFINDSPTLRSESQLSANDRIPILDSSIAPAPLKIF